MLENLEPKKLFYYFEKISDIPRGSGNEKAVSDYIVAFAQDKGFYVYQDDLCNVIVKKPGTVGYENSAPVIIQGHLDMVCEKNKNSTHDFLNDGLELVREGDIIRANGTTLGADNGVAVAVALALLDSTDIAHPPLEVLLTSGEETTMVGAMGIDATKFTGQRMINIDNDAYGEVLTCCAGGAKANIILPVQFESTPSDMEFFTVFVEGLHGGHSGTDIHLQRANALKLMGRTLLALKNTCDASLASIFSGMQDNAIPREAEAVVGVRKPLEGETFETIERLRDTIKAEYSETDPGVNIRIERALSIPGKVFTNESFCKTIQIITLMPCGIENMHPNISGLVETSNNLGVVKQLEDSILFSCAVRSSVASRKVNLLNTLTVLAETVGAQFASLGEYPAWEYNPKSELREIARNVYKTIHNEEMRISAIHAGLECGVLEQKLPGVDIIAIGANLKHAHTPQEELSVSSFRALWGYVVELLKNLV